MCGILAIFGSSLPEGELRELLMKGSKRLRHRGPDWSGYQIHGNNGIAHERLAIMDPASGAQPMTDHDDNVVLCANGEIYNYKEVYAALPTPYNPKSGSDCECVIPAYLAYGKDFPNHLRGMFSFVVYDKRDNSYIACRDHIGITPLYIGYGKDGSVWFASEMKALHDACARYEQFPPGHIYNSKIQGFERWYNPEYITRTDLPSNPVDYTALRESFERAVVRRMMSDVPWGVLLSGGLDSSLVASICVRHMNDDPNAPFPRLHSFSVGLKDSPDLKAAKEVAEHIGTIHHNMEYTIQEGLDAIRDVIHHVETYDVTTIRASTPMYLMSRKIKAMGIKMVLSGEGADEVFGGYLYFHKAPNAQEFQEELKEKINRLHMYDCLRANKAVSSWGVEPRVPFLDYDFLEHAMGIDPNEKMIKRDEGRIEKYILRKAFDVEENPYLPKSVLWRQKEQFSDGVGYSWIDTLKEVAEAEITDDMFTHAKNRYPYNTPQTKEAYYYRQIFEEIFPSPAAAQTVPGGFSIACSTERALAWDASFATRGDASGRAVAGVHDDAYTEGHDVKKANSKNAPAAATAEEPAAKKARTEEEEAKA